MKNRTKIFILIILLLFLLSPPLKLPVTRNRDNIAAAASPTERVDNTTYTIYFAKAVPSVSESAFSPYHFVEVNVTGDVIDVEDAFDWLVARDAASCIDGSYSSFMVRGLGRYIVKATSDNLKITLRWGIMISTAIPALTPGTFHYYITFASSYAPGGYVSYSGSNTIKFQIFNATTGKYVNIFTSTYFSDVAIGSYTITSHLISNGYVYLKAYFESKATIETDAGGYIQIPNIAKEEAIFIYQLYISRDPLTSTVYIEHRPEEDYVYHHLRIYNPEYATKIVVNKPSNWNFYLISPNATVTEYADNITITDTIPTTYDIYFTSTDFQNYPRKYVTAISMFNQKDQYIPFESLFVYYNLSWTELAVEPTWNPLYDRVFTMDKAQYLHIKVYDRWGSALLDKRNLTYQEFYNFTITMYTFKLINFQDDFVYMQIKRAEAVDWYTEWIAPSEIDEELLGPGWYNLTIQFKNGTEIHEDFYLNTDTTYIVEGWTLRKLAGRVDINFSHLLPISLRSNYTNEEIPMRYVILYVNSYQSSDRVLYIEGDWANITIYDVFNHLLADKKYNVTEVGWVNIGLNVTHLVLKNPYEIYGVRIALTSQTTGASRTFYIPPLETVDTFVANDTYNYIVDLMDPSFTDVKRTVQGSFTIDSGQVEYIVLFGWNIFPDAYMQVNFLGETGTINLICEIMIYMNYSKLPIPSVYLEAYINDTLAGTGWTDSQGRAAIILDKPLNGSGTLSIKATKLGVTRWYNTTYSIWGWMTVEEPPMIVQGEVGSYNLIFSNPSRVGETPIKIENATVIFKIYDENATTPTVTLNKTTIDIPPGSSQFTFTLNTTDLPTGNYILEIEVIYANSTFAKKQIPFTVTPKPEYRIVVPWWLILTIVFIALAASIIAWLVIRYMGEITRKTPQGKIKFKPRVLRNLD